jgi:hypothetical protein
MEEPPRRHAARNDEEDERSCLVLCFVLVAVPNDTDYE